MIEWLAARPAPMCCRVLSFVPQPNEIAVLVLVAEGVVILERPPVT